MWRDRVALRWSRYRPKGYFLGISVKPGYIPVKNEPVESWESTPRKTPTHLAWTRSADFLMFRRPTRYPTYYRLSGLFYFFIVNVIIRKHYSLTHTCVINRFSSNFPTCVSVGYISIMYLSETRMNLRKFIWPWMRVCSNAGHRLRYGNLGPTHTHTALRASLQAIKYKVRSYCLSFSSLETHIDSIIFHKLVRFN